MREFTNSRKFILSVNLFKCSDPLFFTAYKTTKRNEMNFKLCSIMQGVYQLWSIPIEENATVIILHSDWVNVGIACKISTPMGFRRENTGICQNVEFIDWLHGGSSNFSGSIYLEWTPQIIKSIEYLMSHEIYAHSFDVLYFVVVIVWIRNRFIWFIDPYSSRLFHWHSTDLVPVKYRQTFNTRRNLVGNKPVDPSDVDCR